MRNFFGSFRWRRLILMCGIQGVVLLLLFSTSADSQVREIHIKAVGGLQFDQVRFQARPGERLRIILTNADDMNHNMLFTRPGKRETVVEAAFQLAEKGPDFEFIPKSEDVLWSIGVLGPGESDTLEFSVPTVKGVYPYVCTYPGHGTIMYGAMYVTEEELPDIREDQHIPPQRRGAQVGGQGQSNDHAQHESRPVWHPYDLVPPYWYRIFMPNSGPASIAVNLNDAVAYCWDAGLCRLRYIWVGDFLDISKPWSIKGDASAVVLGDVIYTEDDFPLDLGVGSGEVEYQGFRLNEEGFPEFYYTIDGVEVHELIHPSDHQRGVFRKFRIGKGADRVIFRASTSDEVELGSDRGTWSGNTLEIREESPVEFEIEMTWAREKN